MKKSNLEQQISNKIVGKKNEKEKTNNILDEQYTFYPYPMKILQLMYKVLGLRRCSFSPNTLVCKVQSSSVLLVHLRIHFLYFRFKQLN